MNYPKVSILVIAYNQASFIEETINSCLAQDYQNIEIVVSDDGSTDGTADILAKLHNQNPEKIKLILNENNKGIVKNSNIALSHCSGELVAFMGGDDVLYSKKISIQVAAFVNNPKLVFCYHPCHILVDGKIIHTIGDRNKDLVRNFYEMISNYGAQIPGPVPMIASWALPDKGFNESIGTACDWLLFIEVSAKGEIIRLDQVLSKYRMHDNNIGKKVFAYGDDFLKTLDVVEAEFADDPNVSDYCSIGRNRFLLGIIYNAMLNQNKSAFAYYLSKYRASGGRFSSSLALCNSLPFSSIVLSSLRNMLKKVV